MAERRGPDEGPEDLFEDLDKFFQSVDEDDWPEPIGSGRGPEPMEPASGGPEHPMTSTPEPEAAEPSVEPDRPEEVPPTAAAVEAGAGPTEEAPAPAGEMSPTDWSRLRDVLREDDDALDYPGREETTEESLFGYPGVGEEEEPAAMSGWETGGSGGWTDDEDEREPGPTEPGPGPESEPGHERELTIDDLRKAPPQYRDLPGPRDQETSGQTPESEPAPAPESLGADLEGDPSLADVEAAADRVADAFAAASGLSGEEGSRGEPELEGDESGTPEPEAPDRPTSPSRWLDEEYEEPGESPPVEDDLVTGLTQATERRKVKVGDPEALLGPAWEDPTARTVGAEPPGGPRAGRNIPLAVVSAAILAVVALFFVLISPWLFTILGGGVVLFAQYELYTTSQKRGYHPAIALGLVTGGLTIAAAYFKGEQAMAFMVALTAVLAFLWYMASPAKARAGTVANISLTVLGVVYLPFLASFIVLILTQATSGKGLMLSVLGLTFLYDVAAFLIGSWYGTHPLAPTISPKKSWEGLIGATITTIVISMAFVSQVGPMTLMRAVGLALVVCVFAPLGDLAESTIKRDLGVKDMGSIMPGHGGLLDRIDSLLFVAPAAFYFLRVIF